jgi:hypothetical protein
MELLTMENCAIRTTFDLELDLRKKIFSILVDEFGKVRGELNKALNEAAKDWIEKKRREKEGQLASEIKK